MIIYICSLILISILLYFYFKRAILSRKKEWSYTFYRTQKLTRSNTMEIVLNNLTYKSTTQNNATLYLPSGYNNAENELKHMHVYPANKIIFGISGCDKIAAKDALWTMLSKYYGRYTAGLYMPNTYLNNSSDLLKLQKEYDPNKKYILKKNIQRKEGIYIASNLQQIFDKASLKTKKDFKIIQEYIPNPLLIDNHKLNLRLYVLIVMNKNQFGAYCYKDGKCMYTKKPYSPDSINFEETITNFDTGPEIYSKLPLTWNELQNYAKIKQIPNAEMLSQNTIFKMLSAVCMPLKKYLDKPWKFRNTINLQLFGVDVIFKPEPILLEFNKGPDMSFSSNKEKELKTSILNDCLELDLRNFSAL